MIERAKSIHGFLIIFRQKQLFNLITVVLYYVWINKAGKAVPILLENLDEHKNVRIDVVDEFRGVEGLFVSKSNHYIEKTATRHCSTLHEKVGDFLCHPATTRDADEIFESPRDRRKKTMVESSSRATIDGVF